MVFCAKYYRALADAIREASTEDQLNRDIRTLGLRSAAILFGLLGCGGAGGSGGPGYDGGNPNAVDLAVSSDPKPAPDVAVDVSICDQLATAAETQFQSFLDSTSPPACQVDSDCEFLYTPQSMDCFAACGMLMGKATMSAITSAGIGFCDQYFEAGCPAITPPCAAPEPTCGSSGTCGCEHGQCVWVSPSGLDATTSPDAGVVSP